MVEVRDEAILGYKTYSHTTCEKRDDRWTVNIIVGQERTYDLKEWEKREATMQATDISFDIAFSQAMTSMAIYLESVNGDLFEQMKLVEETPKSIDEPATLTPKKEYVQ